MKRMIISSTTPDGGDNINFAMFYTGPGYGNSRKAAEEYGLAHNMNNIYYGSDEAYGMKGVYNGSTYVVFNDADRLPKGYSEDAKRFGQSIV